MTEDDVVEAPCCIRCRNALGDCRCPFGAQTASNGETIACPHCGEEQKDIKERATAEVPNVEVECGSCGGVILLSRSEMVLFRAQAIVEE